MMSVSDFHIEYFKEKSVHFFVHTTAESILDQKVILLMIKTLVWICTGNHYCFLTFHSEVIVSP
jgi:hypothetical protein